MREMALATGVAISLIAFGAMLGNTATNDWWRKEAVSKGFAEYNQQIGAWQLKEANDGK